MKISFKSEDEPSVLSTGNGSSYKTCEVCSQTLSVDTFYKKAHGLDSACKSCRRWQRRKRYQEVKSAEINGDSTLPKSAVHQGKPAPKKPLLEPHLINQLADFFLILEGWQSDLDTQRDVSNSKVDEVSKNE